MPPAYIYGFCCIKSGRYQNVKKEKRSAVLATSVRSLQSQDQSQVASQDAPHPAAAAP